MHVWILFHETNTGGTEESDGYVEAVYLTEALAEQAKLHAIRAAVGAGLSVYWNPDDPDAEGPADWAHDWRVECHDVRSAARTDGFAWLPEVR